LVGIHAASDTFTRSRIRRTIQVATSRMRQRRSLPPNAWRGIHRHGSTPRLQDAPLIVNDPKFPGLEHVTSPVSFNESGIR